jgi:hypothetical protein
MMQESELHIIQAVNTSQAGDAQAEARGTAMAQQTWINSICVISFLFTLSDLRHRVAGAVVHAVYCKNSICTGYG